MGNSWEDTMTIDYDGVIIGGTWQAREAAARATRQGARVALVEPPGAVEEQLWRQLTVQVLMRAGAARQQIFPLKPIERITKEEWGSLRQQVHFAADVTDPHLGLDTLAIRGVDVVLEPGQFSPKPRLTFVTETRRLRGRGYLLSPPTRVTVPAIPGLGGTSLLTPETLLDLEEPPQSLVILGRSPDAIALAQALAQLGIQTTLVTRGSQLLPTEDQDISDFIESLLMAAGVNLRLNAKLNSIDHADHVIFQLNHGDRIKASHGLMATARRPELASLNLERVNVKTTPARYLSVDDQLRTTRSRCFAFGPGLGGYWADHTDDQDGRAALYNALYLPWKRIQQLNRVGWMATTPEFARFGMTAQQAIRAYGEAAWVVQIPYEKVASSHLDTRITGFCRCIIHQRGQILGAQIVGARASDLAQTLALLAHQQIPIQHMAQLTSLPMTYTYLLHHICEAWQKLRWRPGLWRRDWAENWFNWRRSRHSS
jgi:pyruvate/2-oxoglutarate dehydrogenase complex dihydrolipoamide dehydrogenase (E3) component